MNIPRKESPAGLPGHGERAPIPSELVGEGEFGLPDYPPPEVLPSGLMKYHTYEEMVALFTQLADSDYATLEIIGTSDNYKEWPAQTPAYEIPALRVGYPDVVEPAILFNGGIHAREWLASESLIELAIYLVDHAADEESGVPSLLRRAPVWIIPMSDPAGRIIDDLGGGDPRDFYRGAEFAPDQGNLVDGWRHNGDTRQCKYGVDINRNFSHGWSSASDKCLPGEEDPSNPGTYLARGVHYRGIEPFSTTEAAALRQFVQNHWICMVVDVHSNYQRIWNRWGEIDKPGCAIKEGAAEHWASGLPALASSVGVADHTSLQLSLDPDIPTAVGEGQFTAWLGTKGPAIQAFFLELPFYQPVLHNYYNGEFEYQSHDSNSFHPSGAAVRDLIQLCFIPMACYLIERAPYPSCLTQIQKIDMPGMPPAIQEVIIPWPSFDLDYCILAAKVGTAPDAPGEIKSYPSAFLPPLSVGGGWSMYRHAYDYLSPDNQYCLYYWVQNNSADPSYEPGVCEVRFCLEYWDGSAGQWTEMASEQKTFSLDRLERTYDEICFVLEPDLEYKLSIEVRPEGGFEGKGWTDDFPQNDAKVFEFTSVFRP